MSVLEELEQATYFNEDIAVMNATQGEKPPYREHTCRVMWQIQRAQRTVCIHTRSALPLDHALTHPLCALTHLAPQLVRPSTALPSTPRPRCASSWPPPMRFPFR